MVIEKILIKYLSEKLDVPVYAEEPLKAGSAYIVLQKTADSYKSKGLNQAIIDLDIYDLSMQKAEDLADKVVMAMVDLPELDEISSSYLNSCHIETDIAKKKYRSEAVFSIIYFQDY